jgi:hypothetical protein
MAAAGALSMVWDLYNLTEHHRSTPVEIGRMISGAAFLLLYSMRSRLAWGAVFGLCFAIAPVYLWTTFMGFSAPLRNGSAMVIWLMVWSLALVYLWKIKGEYVRWTEVQGRTTQLR